MDSSLIQKTPARYHSLDALRAVMMLLGIWLHAVVAYSTEGGWPWKDGAATSVFNWTLGVIHCFRMPIFYVMAGFFSALLLERRSVLGFVRNRVGRILVPFVAGWLILFPLVVLLVFAGTNLVTPGKLGTSHEFFSLNTVLRHAHPLHLWFLEYLLFFYVIVLAANPFLKHRADVMKKVDSIFHRVFASPWRFIVFPAITFPFLGLMKYGWLDDSKGFVPEPKILLVYLIFFAGGWLIYRSADQLPTLAPTHRFLISLILGFAAQCGAFACVTALRGSAANVPRLCLFSCAALNAFAMWAYIFGLIGLFMRFLSKPRRWLRWLSDSSYWLYLAHMPVFLIIQIALVHAGLHAIAKLGILLAISIPVLLASYQFLVRPTFIGAILNGRKYPRGSIEHKHRVQDRSFADI